MELKIHPLVTLSVIIDSDKDHEWTLKPVSKILLILPQYQPHRWQKEKYAKNLYLSVIADNGQPDIMRGPLNVK